MVSKRQLVPFMAHPALGGVHPEGTFFDFLVAKHTREDDLVHVTGHRILDELVVGHLVDAHEHECELTCGAIFVLFNDLHFSSSFMPLDSQFPSLLKDILFFLGFARGLLLRRYVILCKVLLHEILKAFERLKLGGDISLFSFVDHFHFLLLLFKLFLASD